MTKRSKYKAQLASRVLGDYPIDIGSTVEITHPRFQDQEAMILSYWENWWIPFRATSRLQILGANVCTPQGQIYWFPLQYLRRLDLPPFIPPYSVLDISRIRSGTRWLMFSGPYQVDPMRVYTFVGQGSTGPMIIVKYRTGDISEYLGTIRRPVSIIIDY